MAVTGGGGGVNWGPQGTFGGGVFGGGGANGDPVSSMYWKMVPAY